MENVSKALLIAGGVLIAILMLTLIVQVYLSISSFENSQYMKRVTKEIENFNKGYEAYNKTRLYGTEVITVIKKAIDYNKRLDTTDEYYMINIKLETTSEFKKRIVTITYNNDGTSIENEQIDEDNSLSINGDIFDDDFVSQFEGEKGVTVTRNYDSQDRKYTVKYTYSPTYEFGQAIFRCKDVKRNPETGRINEMTFEQIK